MAWHGILGHDDIVAKLRHAITRNRLASTFLFAGPAGIGKRTFALTFAQALLCEKAATQPMDPCGACPSCVMARAGSHPDILRVAKPEDKAYIPVDLLIGESDRRGREGLCHDIGLKAYFGGRKVALIDDADYFNKEGANCLLKTLEEPPPKSVMILIGTSPARQLPTIRSRCQLIRFRPLEESIVAQLLVDKNLVSNGQEAERLAQLSAGSVETALEMADDSLRSWRATFLETLAQRPIASFSIAQSVSTFVDEAGKEAPLRRARLRLIVLFAAQFYRSVMAIANGGPTQADETLYRFASSAAQQLPAAAPLACLERCVEALGQIDRNANQSTLIEAWIDDLAAAG